jgi:hypothetical protein
MDLAKLQEISDFCSIFKPGFDTKLYHFRFESQECCSKFNNSSLEDRFGFVSTVIDFFESVPPDHEIIMPDRKKFIVHNLYFTLTLDQKRLSFWCGEHSDAYSDRVFAGGNGGWLLELTFSYDLTKETNPFIALIESHGYKLTSEEEYYKYTKES